MCIHRKLFQTQARPQSALVTGMSSHWQWSLQESENPTDSPRRPLPHTVPIGDPRLNTQSQELENLVCSTGEKENKAEGSGKKMLPAWSFPAALEGMRDVAWCGVATLLFPWVHGWLLVEGWGDRIEEQSGSWEFSCFEV